MRAPGMRRQHSGSALRAAPAAAVTASPVESALSVTNTKGDSVPLQSLLQGKTVFALLRHLGCLVRDELMSRGSN